MSWNPKTLLSHHKTPATTLYTKPFHSFKTYISTFSTSSSYSSGHTISLQQIFNAYPTHTYPSNADFSEVPKAKRSDHVCYMSYQPNSVFKHIQAYTVPCQTMSVPVFISSTINNTTSMAYSIRQHSQI
jgi:hypothetical protein